MNTPFAAMKIKLISESQHKNSIRLLLKDLQIQHRIGELYAGYSVGLMYIIEGSIQFAIYEEMKKSYDSYFSFFLIGVFSKFIGISLTYPYRLILSIVQSRPINIYTAIKYATKTYGVFGMYKGYSACLARNLPISGFLFMLLELIRNILTRIIYLFIAS